MQNVEELKNLHARLGGNADDVSNLKTNAEVINALSVANVGGGDSSDNIFYVYIKYENGEYTADHTHLEVLEAFEAGKRIIISFFPRGNGSMYQLPLAVTEISMGGVVFYMQDIRILDGGNSLYMVKYKLSGNKVLEEAAVDVFVSTEADG